MPKDMSKTRTNSPQKSRQNVSSTELSANEKLESFTNVVEPIPGIGSKKDFSKQLKE